ncbi:hypothetical protein GQE99_16655 [Maritimibacter sp. DP07]|uniref:Uncharacterized protein n=1 Tax=Maritimibacter harenae TaxID=2606218 RepID=A0A845M605_9RHOB|nr:hypothetical protein [Maritimibacter harenae]MZR14652.1 hypothetical protein [Maritimibacter harenae]
MPAKKMVHGIVVPVTALAIGLGAGTLASVAPLPGFGSAAWAADNAQGPQGDTSGGQGQGSQGAQSGQSNQGGQGTGQAGPGADSDSKGPQAGSPPDRESGGMPPWASEGIPEVELGRLSVARSPDAVIDRAYAEALLVIDSMADFYNLSLDEMIAELSLNWDEITIIDSPLQNLAIFRDALDGSIDLSDYGITNDPFTLMAVTLGVASDKNLPITAETVYAVSVIFEMPLSEADSIALAEAAEAIRIAVLSGHG